MLIDSKLSSYKRWQSVGQSEQIHQFDRTNGHHKKSKPSDMTQSAELKLFDQFEVPEVLGESFQPIDVRGFRFSMVPVGLTKFHMFATSSSYSS